jgi:hypothetical protein
MHAADVSVMTGTDHETSMIARRSVRSIASEAQVRMNSRIGFRPTTARFGRTLAVVATIAIGLASSTARADEPSDYCRKVTAHAEGDAALLYAPTVHLQVIRYPNTVGSADPSGLQLGSGVQPRASVSFGLLDFYKGFGVRNVARMDCRRQQSAVALEEVVAQRGDVGRLPALENKLAFLREHRGAVEEIVRNAEERFTARTATLAEVQDLRLRALAFDRAAIETEREIQVLRARAVAPSAQPLADDLRTYEKRTVELEESIAHVRNLAPWKLAVTAGVTGSPNVDAFGVAELSYNFGGLFQHGAEHRAVLARADELKNARYEMRQQLERATRELRASAEQNRAEANAIGAVIARMTRDRASLESTEAPNKRTVIAGMTLGILDLEAEQAFLTTLADKQSAFGASK